MNVLSISAKLNEDIFHWVSLNLYNILGISKHDEPFDAISVIESEIIHFYKNIRAIRLFKKFIGSIHR